MKILAIDTTGLTASVAIVDENNIIAEFTLNYKKTHSQTIMPLIEYMVKMIDFDLSSIDYIACSNGPGSFTGLRIGASTAKGFAHGLNKRIVPVPTLDAIAYNIFETDNIIVPIMDARRNQVYTAFYIWENNKFKRISSYMAEDINTVLNELKNNNKNVIFLGDGVSVHKQTIISFNKNYIFAPQNVNMQKAASVASIAFNLISEGKDVSYSDFNIFYLRQSQAEREYERKK